MKILAIRCLLFFFELSLVTATGEEESVSNIACGDRLISPTGTIQTPNFPKAFGVPITCRWVIDVSDIPSNNASIVVYMTQLYVYKGLKFIEYAYYESQAMNFGANLVKEITEGNIFEHRWIRTFRPFLVVEFQLDRLEGNHVRVLDHFLDVYGFNITYQLTENEPNFDSCSVSGCSFTGDCLVSADNTKFTCHCFSGFSGVNCHEGPLCFNERVKSVCQNNGVCKQIGAKTIYCDCPFEYVGPNCEIQLSNRLDDDCEEENCIVQCSYTEGERHPCTCRNGTKIYNNRSRYECRIKLSNVTSLRTGLVAQHGSLESFLGKQLLKYLRNSNISFTEDLKILSVTPTSEVTFHFFGNSDDGDKIRESLNRLVQRRKLGEISLESTHFTFQQKPALRLQSLRLDRSNEHEVHLGDEISLSCVAQGSYVINFTWYKDNMLVNESKSMRNIWYGTLPNDGSDVYTSVLRIDKATILDSGQYTCQAIDQGVQQCKSVYVEIRDEPDVKVLPMSATVEKGSNIKLTCTTSNVHSTGIGFGWTKNRALLKLEPSSEVWEDLYPAGSILKISNVQKSAIYTCNVAHKFMSVRVEVVNKTLVPTCTKEKSWGLQWPDTAPGLEALLECPRYLAGRQVSRLCSMKDATTPEWLTPDFSSCLYEPLLLPYNRFRSLTLGYENTTGSETIFAFWQILQERELPLYPGEGDRILNLLVEIEKYQRNVDSEDLYHSAEPLMRIVNRILSEEGSITGPQKLSMLLHLVERNLVHGSNKPNHDCTHLSLSSMVVDIQLLQTHDSDSITHSLQIPTDDYTYPEWYNDKVAIRVWKKRHRDGKSNSTYRGIIVVYKNVSAFLPNAYVKELDDGTDLEYRINSRAITVSIPSFVTDKHSKIWVDLQMRQLQNYSGSWNISCGLMNSFGSWDLQSCIANTLSGDMTTHCLCPGTGTVAVFLTARAVRVSNFHNVVLAEKEQTTFIVLFGCGSCLVECSLSLLLVGIYWWKHRNWLNFLKLQCCIALIGAMAIFIYAIHDNLPDTHYSLVAIGLEAFLLVGTSTPISEALIIYAELAQIRLSQHFQPTVIAVITGVPILAVLATELTHKSTGWRHESWWLIYGSGVYNIFVTCAVVMFFIFMLLYMGVLHKAHSLVEENIMKKETIETRIQLLHRAALIICGIITMEASSIFYINSISVIFHYVFASLSSALGFIILISYIMSGEIGMLGPILRKLKSRLETSSEQNSEPIKVYSKAGTEAENDAAPPPPPSIVGESYIEARGVAAGSIDMREFITESSTSYSKSSITTAPRFLPEIRINRSEDINLENYSTSPRKYQESFDAAYTKRASQCLGTESYAINDHCTFLDFTSKRSSVSTECSAKLLCSADIESRLTSMPDVTLAVKSDVELAAAVELKGREHVNVIPDIASTAERKQPDGEEKSPEILIGSCETTTSGMLDRISHDLDYLLNRTHATEET